MIASKITVPYQSFYIAVKTLRWVQKVGFSIGNSSSNIHIPSSRISSSRNYNHIKTPTNNQMSYFVIGVSGITCGGKTTLTKLLQRSFPWCRIIHQDHYFYDDDYKDHVRVPEVENHVNYEILNAMNMEQMYKDVQTVLDGPGEFFDGRPNGIKVHDSKVVANSKPEDAPNFDSGMELLKSVGKLDYDTSIYKDIPILILEGFVLFESEFLYDKCDVRFFATLDQNECRTRRSTRCYNPPDTEGYFDKIVWPEYAKHFEKFVNKRPGIKVFEGTTPIEVLWKESIQIATCRIKEKYFLKEETEENKSSNQL